MNVNWEQGCAVSFLGIHVQCLGKWKGWATKSWAYSQTRFPVKSLINNKHVIMQNPTELETNTRNRKYMCHS